jgi:hypothetical protein
MIPCVGFRPLGSIDAEALARRPSNDNVQPVFNNGRTMLPNLFGSEILYRLHKRNGGLEIGLESLGGSLVNLIEKSTVESCGVEADG